MFHNFFLRNVRIGPISCSVCTRQAFSAEPNACKYGLSLPTLGKPLALSIFIRLGRKGLPGTNAQACLA
jgi:hypothetical protein